MGCAGRLEINVLDTGLGQLVAEILCPGAFRGTDSQEEELDLRIKRGRIKGLKACNKCQSSTRRGDEFPTRDFDAHVSKNSQF